MRMVFECTPKEGEEAREHEGGENVVVDEDLVVAMEAEDDDVDLEELDENERREFNALNRQLDELDRVLDSLEHKNDVIHSQLKELLADNKQARQDKQDVDDPEEGQNK